MKTQLSQLTTQPRSQGLSPLPPLSLGKETLVSASHVTTQNLGGKKICWTGGVAECFDCCCGTLWVSKSRAAVKNYPLYQGLIWKFADEEMLHYFCCVQNIEDFRSKEIRQPNGAQTFQRLAHVKRHVPNRSETSISVS